jgi:predicted DNA-binding antitoxin AbrB/MazE fold protein
MTMRIDAIYENGALRPLQPLPLVEHQQVTVVISEVAAPIERSRMDVNYMEEAKREVAKMARIPTLLEVQQRLSKISGSIAREIEAEREDR